MQAVTYLGGSVCLSVEFKRSNRRDTLPISFKAFGDTWHWDQSAALAFQEVVESGGKVSQVMQAFRTFLGENDMLAYAHALIELVSGLENIQRGLSVAVHRSRGSWSRAETL